MRAPFSPFFVRLEQSVGMFFLTRSCTHSCGKPCTLGAHMEELYSVCVCICACVSVIRFLWSVAVSGLYQRVRESTGRKQCVSHINHVGESILKQRCLPLIISCLERRLAHRSVRLMPSCHTHSVRHSPVVLSPRVHEGSSEMHILLLSPVSVSSRMWEIPAFHSFLQWPHSALL